MSKEIVTLEQVYNLTDLATDALWYMEFIKLPKTSVTITAEELNIRCQEFTVPSVAVKNLTATIHTHTRNQSTITQQPQEITIPLIETADMKTTKWLTAWRDTCSKPNTNYVSTPEDRYASIQFYHFNGQQEVVYTTLIEFCEFRDMGGIQYKNGADPGAIIRQVKLQCGRVKEL